MNDINTLAGGTFEIDFKVNRDRSMSFEFFAFQMEEVEETTEGLAHSGLAHSGLQVDLGTLPMGSPLPPHTPSAGQRERGDSIIFDPKSFSDGGIHELKVLKTITEVKTPKEEPVKEEPSVREEPKVDKRIIGGIR